jgi:hypothetical protein
MNKTGWIIAVILFLVILLILFGLVFIVFFREGGVTEQPLISKTTRLDNPVCDSDTYNCDDFDNQQIAQEVFDKCGGPENDIHRLDSNNDGVACESLV